MDGGFPFLDILFFAMVAAFLVLRLRGVLGRRTGHEKQRHDERFQTQPQRDAASPSDNVVNLPHRGKSDEELIPGSATEPPSGTAAIQAADPRFREGEFLQGARTAFEMIVHAFANGDRDTLRALTSGEVFANFEEAIRDREEKSLVMETTLVGVDEVSVVDAGLDEREARITVHFSSEQVNVLRDAEGMQVSGSSNAVEQVTDTWTFARDVRSSNPNWLLVATDVG